MAAKVTDTATEVAFSLGWRAVRRVPERTAYRLFDRAADQLWKRQGAGVVQYQRNLSRVHPEASTSDLRELSRLGMRSHMRYWCEAFRLPSWSRERISEGFILENVHLLDDAMSSGSGAVMVVNHGGNWDHAGAWGALRYGHLTTVAEHLKPEGVFQQFLTYRQSLGMEILPLGDTDTFRVLVDRLRGGGLVPLAGDRDISRRGISVEFFGEPASMPAGPALLGLLTGAPVYPVTLTFGDGVSLGKVHDRIEVPSQGSRDEKVRAMTQGLAKAWESSIPARSQDWHVMQPLWLADLDPHRRSA
jgi:lauroyl/myristoyl acyltransferase